ncbi:MAG: MerR family transcriptional regulator [Desulfuromonadales bacterium C00003068]|jgi:DNA-binding transcriptional MerR regulator|nr:MAG: MerR family transcriptional regulator [Desulfuromonadales bacterium C00003068]
MKYKNKYSIGEVSKRCNISTKALRYYDKLGLIKSKRDDINNYRYYSKEALLAVPVIKYYKQMGFTLEEMKYFIEGKVDVERSIYNAIKRSFTTKIEHLQKILEETQRQYTSVKDWFDLITEAEMVIDNNIHEVSVKFIEPSTYLYQEQQFLNDIKASIINIKFTNYVEEINNEITGPVIINFSSSNDRMKNKDQPIKILQKTLKKCKENETIGLGKHIMVSCYHIGSHDNINDTYEKIYHWASEHGYILGEESFERYVTDYWTTSNSALYVTEVLMNASRK